MAKVINVVYKVDDKALLKAKTEIHGIEKETKDSEREMLKLDKAIQKVGNDGGKSFLNFKNIVGAISVVGIVASLTTLGKKIFELGVKQEQLNIAFSTFLGSAQKAKILLGDLTKFAIVTPFSPDQVNNAAKALLAFGVNGKEIIPTLKMLGDVSAGTGKDLTEMAIIFGQIRSTGRLMGQDLLQLINAGFNPLQIISEKTGKSVAKLKEEMEKGNISFNMVADAFKTATSEGGLFFNLMEKQSQSIGGLMSTIEGNVEEGFKNIFTTAKGPLKDFVDQLVTLSEAFMEFTKSKDQLADEQETKVISESIEVYNKLNKAYGDSKRAVDLTTEAVKKRKQAIEEEQTGLLKIVNAPAPLFGDDLKTRAYKQTASDRIAYLNNEWLVLDTKVIPAIQQHIVEEELEAKATKKTGDETKLTTEQLKKRAKALEEINKQLGFTKASDKVKAKEKGDDEEAKKQSDAIDREIEQNERRSAVLKDNNKDMEDEVTRQAEESAEERKRIADEEAENRNAAIQRSYDLAIQLGAALLESALMEREVDTQSISDKYEKELELAGDNDKAKEAIEKERDKKLRAAEAKNKEIQKRNARTKILIDTAVAVIKTMADFGYPWGLIPAGLMIAMGAVNVANVNKYKKGKVNINGHGTGTSDSIPAMISNGESVINAVATSRSKNLLEAINDRRIDDNILNNIAANGGSRAMEFDYTRMGEEFRKNKTDYDTHGYTIMNGIQKGKNFKMFIRSKVQGYK